MATDEGILPTVAASPELQSDSLPPAGERSIGSTGAASGVSFTQSAVDVLNQAVAAVVADGGQALGRHDVTQSQLFTIPLPETAGEIGVIVVCESAGPNWSVSVGPDSDDSRQTFATCAGSDAAYGASFPILDSEKNAPMKITVTKDGESMIYVVPFWRLAD